MQSRPPPGKISVLVFSQDPMHFVGFCATRPQIVLSVLTSRVTSFDALLLLWDVFPFPPPSNDWLVHLENLNDHSRGLSRNQKRSETVMCPQQGLRCQHNNSKRSFWVPCPAPTSRSRCTNSLLFPILRAGRRAGGRAASLKCPLCLGVGDYLEQVNLGCPGPFFFSLWS